MCVHVHKWDVQMRLLYLDAAVLYPAAQWEAIIVIRDVIVIGDIIAIILSH